MKRILSILLVLSIITTCAFAQSSGGGGIQPVERGGTGAKTAAAARLNLGVATGYSVVAGNVAALKATSVTGLPDGTVIVVLGYASANDGGGGSFQYSAAASEADDGGTVLAPASGSGRWKRAFNGRVNVRWFGAKGDATTDDSASFTAALAAGQSVLVPSGTYVVSGLQPGAGREIVGEKGATLKLKTGETKLIDIVNSDVTVRNLVLDGGNLGPWAVPSVTVGDRVGISINNDAGLERITLADIEVKGFSLGGIVGVKTVIGYAFGHRLTMVNINAHHNYVGIGLNPYCEYTLTTASYCYKNHIGVYAPGGNNKFVGCNFEENFRNCQIEAGYNNSHGGFFGCSFNHAATGQAGALGLYGNGVENGMLFVGCTFWYGNIQLVDCTGVHVVDGQFGSSITVNVSGGGLNKIHSNYAPNGVNLVLASNARVQFRDNLTAAGGTQDYFAKWGDWIVTADGSAYSDGQQFDSGGGADLKLPFSYTEKRSYGLTKASLNVDHVSFAEVTGYYDINASFGFSAHAGALDQTVTLKLKTYLADGVTLKKSYDVGMVLKAGQTNAVLKISEKVYLQYGETFTVTFSNSDSNGVDVINAQTYLRAIKEL